MSPVDFKKSPCRPVEFKKWPCRPVDFRGLDPFYCSLVSSLGILPVTLQTPHRLLPGNMEPLHSMLLYSLNSCRLKINCMLLAIYNMT